MGARRSGLGLIAAFAAFGALATLGAPRAAEAKGAQLVLIGGEVTDERIFREIVARAGGARARVGIVTAASSKAEENGRHWEGVFAAAGAASATWLPLDGTENADDYDVIFFGGGGQDRLKRALTTGRSVPFLARTKQRFAAGSLLVAGTSAGAAVQPSAPMILGGEGLDAVLGGTPAHDPAGGLGLFVHGLVDTHFAERGRHARITRLASDLGERRAFGVDEDTALFVDDALGPRTRMSVVGRGGVSVFDLDRAHRSPGARFAIDRVRLDVLTHGDELDPSTGKVRLAGGKRPTRGPALRASDLPDAFSSTRHLGEGGKRAATRGLARLATVAAGQRRTIDAHAWESTQARVTIGAGATTGAFARPGDAGPASLVHVLLGLRDAGPRRGGVDRGPRGR